VFISPSLFCLCLSGLLVSTCVCSAPVAVYHRGQASRSSEKHGQASRD